MFVFKYLRFVKILLILFLPLILVNSSALFAENPNKTFSSLTFKLNLLTNTNRNTLHQYWSPYLGGEAEVETPFYAGNIQAGLHLFQFNGKQEAYVDYWVTFLYISWGRDISLLSQIKWFNGIRIGSYQMRFDDTEINPTQRVESELAAGFDSRFKIEISSQWSCQLGIGYIVVFTHKKLELMNLSVGVAYMIDSPTWLMEFLR